MADWYCVHTKPNMESRAARNIKAAGYRTLLPSYYKTVRHAGRVNITEAPYFSRYLFAFVPEHKTWGPISRADGVNRIISDGGRPSTVPARMMSELLARFSGGPITEAIAEDWLATLAIGTPLNVTTGPLAYRTAPYQGLDEFGQVKLWLDILGRGMEISVPREHVAAVG